MFADVGAAKIAVIGLGYVGLPLALAFGRSFQTIGYDINTTRVASLRAGRDDNGEESAADLSASKLLSFSTELDDLKDYNFFIVTVPTPINEAKQPDLRPLIAASKSLATIIKPGAIVVYESTVYPGAVEEVCLPLLCQSGLEYNKDFYLGYSPERINPGDKNRGLADIVKVTSGSTPAASDYIDKVYKAVVKAGTHKVSSIKVAEAAKVIENTQRDLNIALINELAIIFDKIGIDTEEVLDAAATKWNFLRFSPGLVGGHCIGVDPYYLSYKALQLGYNPEIIAAGRRINDNMGKYVAERLVKRMIREKIHVDEARIIILGFAFKENCPDSRNTKVIDIVRELESYGAKPEVYDPVISRDATYAEYGLELATELNSGSYDAIVLAVAHQQFRQMTVADIRSLGKEKHVLFDVKHVFKADEVELRL